MTPVDRFLEFHDADLLAIDAEGETILVKLDAYVHQWERGTDARLRGTEWTQECCLELKSARIEESPTRLPVRLSDGVLQAATSEGSDGTLTLPSTIEGPCLLDLQTDQGERLRITARDASVRTTGEPTFIEDLPPELAPDP